MLPANKAAWCNGLYKSLRVGAAKTPTPGPDQIVVKNRALAINPADWKMQLSVPFILGQDIAGDVVAVGSSVTRFQIGDRVLSHSDGLMTHEPASGGFQLYTATPASTTARIPDAVSYTDACVLPLALDTAIVGLVDILRQPYPTLGAGAAAGTKKAILVWGGASSVGAVTIQLAVAAGLRVVSTASARNHAFVRGLGAFAVLDYHDADVREQIVRVLRREEDEEGGGGLVGVYDAISEPESYRYTIPLAQEMGKGMLATVLPVPRNLPPGMTAAMVLPIRPDVQGKVWEEFVTPALAQGQLKCAPDTLIVGKGLESVQKGLDTSKAGVSAKKVVVELD